MTKTANDKRGRSWRRWVYRALWGVLTIVVAMVLLWSTGTPQHFAARRILEHMLDCHAEIHGLRIGQVIRVERLVLQDPYFDGPPLVEIHGVQLEIHPFSERPVHSLHFDSLDIAYHVDDVGASSVDFILKMLDLTAPATEPSRYIPRHIHCGRLGLDVVMPDIHAHVDGLSTDVYLESLESFTVRLMGDGLPFRMGLKDASHMTAGSGRFQTVLMRDQEHFTAAVDAHFEDVLDCRLLGGMYFSDNTVQFCFVDIDHMVLTQNALIESFSTPMSLCFDRVHIPAGTLSFAFDTFPQPGGWNGYVNAHIDRLRIGNKEAPLFRGDIALESFWDRDLSADIRMHVNDGPPLQVHSTGLPPDWGLKLQLLEWKRDDFACVFGEQVMESLDVFPGLLALSLDGQFALTSDGYEGKVSMTPQMQGVAAGDLFRAEGHGAFDGVSALFSGEIAADFGDGRADAELVIHSLAQIDLNMHLKELDVARVLRIVDVTLPDDLTSLRVSGDINTLDQEDALRAALQVRRPGHPVLTIEGVVSGFPGDNMLSPVSLETTVRGAGHDGVVQVSAQYSRPDTRWAARIKLDAVSPHHVGLGLLPENPGMQIDGEITLEHAGTDIAVDADLLVADLRWADALLFPGDEPVHIRFQQKIRPDGQLSGGHAAHLRWTEYADLHIADIKLDTSGEKFSCTLDGAFQLDYLADYLDVLCFGDLDLHASLQYVDDTVEAELSLSGTGLGYDRFMSSISDTMGAHVYGRYHIAKNILSISKCEYFWEDTTRIETGPFDLDMQSPSFETSFRLVTDLSPLVELQYADDVQGGDAQFDGMVAWKENMLHAACTFDVHANILNAGSVMALTDMDTKGAVDVQWGKGVARIEGEGIVRCGLAVAGGALVRDIRAQWKGEGEQVGIQAEANVFDGDASAQFVLHLSPDTVSSDFSSTFRQLNLERFTEQVEPPRARMSGLVDGSVSGTLRNKEIENLQVHVVASDGMTLNRDLLEELLRSNLFESYFFGRNVDRMIQQILGKDVQYHFQSANLMAHWASEHDRLPEYGGFLGEITLKSRSFSPTLDFSIEYPSLMEILQIRQENRLDDIEAVQVGFD